jgi:hypothetical protein
MDKHSSLLQKYVNHGRIKFYSTGPQGPESITAVKSFMVQALVIIAYKAGFGQGILKGEVSLYH